MKIKVFNHYNEYLSCTTEDDRRTLIHFWFNKDGSKVNKHGLKGDFRIQIPWPESQLSLDHVFPLTYEEACAIFCCHVRTPFKSRGVKTVDVEKELIRTKVEVCSYCKGIGRVQKPDNPISNWYNVDCTNCDTKGIVSKKLEEAD